MAKLFDGRWDYRGFHGRESWCHLMLFREGAGAPVIALATELPENPGASVANRVEVIASEVCRHFGIEPRCLVFYTRCGTGSRLDPERWNRVSFNPPGQPGSLGRPKWHHSGREVVEILCGEAIPGIEQLSTAAR